MIFLTTAQITRLIRYKIVKALVKGLFLIFILQKIFSTKIIKRIGAVTKRKGFA